MVEFIDRRQILMAATCIAPEAERPVAQKTSPVRRPEPEPKQPIKDLVMQIFEGHEEFLGFTPD